MQHLPALRAWTKQATPSDNRATLTGCTRLDEHQLLAVGSGISNETKASACLETSSFIKKAGQLMCVW